MNCEPFIAVHYKTRYRMEGRGAIGRKMPAVPNGNLFWLASTFQQKGPLSLGRMAPIREQNVLLVVSFQNPFEDRKLFLRGSCGQFLTVGAGDLLEGIDLERFIDQPLGEVELYFAEQV